MRIARGISALKHIARPVVAIGVFDGIHLGHAAILREAVRTAGRIRGTSVVITFWPDPHAQESIYSIGHRLRIMERLGIDLCVLVRFDKAFSRMSAETFAGRIIAGKLGARQVFVGSNFRFGKGLRGTAGQLRLFAKRYGFKVREFGLVRKDGMVVSSTNIRKLITAGKLDKASRLLGRRVSVLGAVVRGRAVGRGLGCRTANVSPDHEVLPPDGVYAAMAAPLRARPGAFPRGEVYQAICYIGSRPTFFPKSKKRNVEVHLFGFSGSLYGRQIEVIFLERLRGDKRFSSPAALAAQIRKDIAASRAIFSRR